MQGDRCTGVSGASTMAEDAVLWQDRYEAFVRLFIDVFPRNEGRAAILSSLEEKRSNFIRDFNSFDSEHYDDNPDFSVLEDVAPITPQWVSRWAEGPASAY